MKQNVGTSSHLGTQLKTLLKQRGLTVETLAQAAHLSVQNLEHLISGEQILTGDVAFLLADFFEMSPVELFMVQSNYQLAIRDATNAESAIAA